MCGIFFCICTEGKCCKNDEVQALVDSVIPLVARRGPDFLRTEEKVIFDQGTGKQIKLNLTGSVLHLRGDLTPQPVQDSKGNALLWNGEVFGGVLVPDNFNDTTILFNLLGNCSDVHSVLSLISTIQGPWAFVYYQASQERLWFGRDFFGRRSLVWHLPTDEEDVFVVSSVTQRDCPENNKKWLWEEVPAKGIYCLEFNPAEDDIDHNVESLQFHSLSLKLYTWTSVETINKDSYSLKQPVLPFNKELPSEMDLKILDEHYRKLNLLTATNGLKDLDKSLLPSNTSNDNLLRTSDPQSTMYNENKLDSNEVESFRKSSKLKMAENTSTSFFGATETKDLHVDNILSHKRSFKDNLPRTSDSQAMVKNENIKVDSSRGKNLEVYNVEPLSKLCSKTISTSDAYDMSSLSHESASNHVTSTQYLDNLPHVLIDILGEAVRKRVFNLPRGECRHNSDKEAHCTTAKHQTDIACQVGHKQLEECSGFKHARVGILFSGGIDSIVLAVLADRYVPDGESIDLINVAFEKKQPQPNPTSKRKPKNSATSDKNPSFDVPDRLTGISGLKELEKINPKRQWNFIEVNVTLKDLQKERCEHITHLVSPLTSVLDDSIGCALWFAAKGSGTLKCPTCIINDVDKACMHPDCYTSLAKVLLVGMGADEQLGGYARHRTKFNQEGWLGLVNEMEMEVSRISQRNLGRDDRCISDHGREARFPFLDEQVVSFLSGIPVWLKADPRLPRGTGEKILLRKSARLLGLTSSAVLPKRAIQFGSRIAKLEGSNEKGSDACARLKS